MAPLSDKCRLRARVAGLLVLALIATAGGRALAAEIVGSSTPYPGVTHIIYSDAAIPARIHVLVVDLTNIELTLHATTEGARGQTLSAYSAEVGTQIVVNGDYYSPIDFETAGLAMGEAELWSDSTDDDTEGFLRFDRNGNTNHISISPPEQVVDPADLEEGTQGVIGGRPMLVRTGVAVTTFDCTDAVAMACTRAPRTAVAVSEDGNTMWLVVVDGWQEDSYGMTAAELAGFLDDLGAYDALMFDGGASSEMYVAAEGGVVSSPSDGSERVVANHLGIHHGPLPPGQLVGLVRERDIYDGANIEGATVTLDSGETDVTGADALYSFSGVTPRYVCATASKAGYRPETRCKQVTSGNLVYNSIPIYPYSDFVDAAPGAPDASLPDAGVVSDAAPPPPDGFDAAGGADAGEPEVNGDCACRTGSDRGPVPVTLWLMLVVVVLLRLAPRARRSSQRPSPHDVS